MGRTGSFRASAGRPPLGPGPPAPGATRPGAPHGSRQGRFSRAAAPHDTPVYRRTDLGVGQQIVGPAIVEERETTAVIRPNWTVTVAADGSLIADWSAPQ